MTREERKYVRVYYDLIREFPTVYADPAALGTWLRLLMVADAMHPGLPELPRSVRPRDLRTLTDAGLVTVTGPTYSLRGLDAERTRRSASGRNAAAVRWQSERSTDVMPRRDETRQDETSTAREIDDGRADLEAFLLLTRRAPTTRQRQLLDGLLDRHDLTGPKWAAQIMLSHPDDPIGAVIAADKEWRAERIAEAQAAEKPTPKPHRPRGLPESTRELIEHWAAQAKEQA